MSRGTYSFKQSDVQRAIRAAKKEGAGEVVVQRDGSILIKLSPPSTAEKPREELERGKGIVL